MYQAPDSGYRRLVQRVLAGGIPRGGDFDACRALLLSRTDDRDATFQALCMLLEGALADPVLAIDETQIVVRLLKDLACDAVDIGDLL